MNIDRVGSSALRLEQSRGETMLEPDEVAHSRNSSVRTLGPREVDYACEREDAIFGFY